MSYIEMKVMADGVMLDDHTHDGFVAMPPTPVARSGISNRKAHKHNTRRRLSKLESRIHHKHSKTLLPARNLYVTVLIALLGTFQRRLDALSAQLQ